MDLVRFGLIIRALRRRRGWRQVDLGLAAGVSQNVISLVERGHGDRMTLATLHRIAAAVGARVMIDLRWRGGELERLLDEDHAALAAAIVRMLRGSGWNVEIEVSYSVYGQHGSIDVVAWQPETRSLLVIEVKTEITSAEATIRKLDEKVRLASRVAFDRFGWSAATVSRLLVIEDTTTARRRVGSAGALFESAFPWRGVAVRRWLRAPSTRLSGLLFLPPKRDVRGMSRSGGRHRVRRCAGATRLDPLSVVEGADSRDRTHHAPPILTNRT